MHRSGPKRYPGYGSRMSGHSAGCRNAVAGCGLYRATWFRRRTNPDNLISTRATPFADPIPPITPAWNLRPRRTTTVCAGGSACKSLLHQEPVFPEIGFGTHNSRNSVDKIDEAARRRDQVQEYRDALFRRITLLEYWYLDLKFAMMFLWKLYFYYIRYCWRSFVDWILVCYLKLKLKLY